MPSAAAGLVRSHLDAEWRGGILPLFNSSTNERRVVRNLRGFAGYGHTVAPFNPGLQSDVTLIFNPGQETTDAMRYWPGMGEVSLRVLDHARQWCVLAYL